MNKYQILQKKLNEDGEGQMKVFGNSMLPLIKSDSVLTFRPFETYEVGDIVFSKVGGRFIDAHKIVQKVAEKGGFKYLIANNKGYENGWTRQVYGKVVAIQPPGN